MTGTVLQSWKEATPTQRRLVIYSAVGVGGWLADNNVALGIGLAGAIAAAIEVWTDAQITANPDTMNAYFKTGGRLSGTRSDTEARLLRKIES